MPHLQDLSTPCLVLDLDKFEANLERMKQFSLEKKIALRPHAKTHKCVEVARRQIARGAIGICVATIAEAEVFTQAGIRGILITSELVGRPKLSRLMNVLTVAPDTMLVVDDSANVSALQDAARQAGLYVTVLIDLDVGQNRTGILPGEPARRLAQTIKDCPNLELVGICAYAGHLAHVADAQSRTIASQQAWQYALETTDLLGRDGHDIRIVTGTSTGTYNIDAVIPGVTEIQAGSYVFMDVEYLTVHRDFVPALTVLATVIHRSGNKAIVDAGLKAFATDRPFGPEPLNLSGARYEFAGDEHGRLVMESDSLALKLGDTVRFILPHCDPNVNLYDKLFAFRGEQVTEVWPIMGRSGGYF
jgi:D-serine deaminase-like pyridoxal phosphate-dependent protein